MCRSRTERKSDSRARLIAAAVAAAALGTALGGCSEIYFDRREGVTLGGGDAVAANATMQTIDPWPARSGNTNIAENGQRMQSAVERYRTGRVIQPVKPTTSDVQNQQEAATAAAASYGAAAATTPPPNSTSTSSSASSQ